MKKLPISKHCLTQKIQKTEISLNRVFFNCLVLTRAEASRLEKTNASCNDYAIPPEIDDLLD